MVDAKEDIEYDAHQRQEEDDQCPSHGLGGLAVVHHDVNDRQCYHAPQQRHADDVKQSSHPLTPHLLILNSKFLIKLSHPIPADEPEHYATPVSACIPPSVHG